MINVGSIGMGNAVPKAKVEFLEAVMIASGFQPSGHTHTFMAATTLCHVGLRICQKTWRRQKYKGRGTHIESQKVTLAPLIRPTPRFELGPFAQPLNWLGIKYFTNRLYWAAVPDFDFWRKSFSTHRRPSFPSGLVFPLQSSRSNGGEAQLYNFFSKEPLLHQCLVSLAHRISSISSSALIWRRRSIFRDGRSR